MLGGGVGACVGELLQALQHGGKTGTYEFVESCFVTDIAIIVKMSSSANRSSKFLNVIS